MLHKDTYTQEKCKIIVIEGIDGSGKTVQSDALVEFLRNRRKKVKSLSFPNYGGFFGSEIGKLLSGQYRISAENLDSKSMSLWYALDRYSVMKEIDYEQYDYIIINRYTLSSVVYQSIRDKENTNIVDWIVQLEHKQLNIPEPNLYIVLDVTPANSAENILNKGKREYLEAQKDVYERDEKLLQLARYKYKELSNSMNNIQIIDCIDEEGKIKKMEQIQNLIIGVLKEWNLLDIIQ